MVLKREKENQYTSCKKKGTIKQIYVDYRELIHEVNEKENTRIAAKRSSEKKKTTKDGQKRDDKHTWQGIANSRRFYLIIIFFTNSRVNEK